MKTLTDYQECPNCGALNPPDVEYCAKCKLALGEIKLGFFNPRNYGHNTLCAMVKLSSRMISMMDGGEMWKMVESRIAEAMADKLIEDNVVKIEHYYEQAEDSMCFVGYLNILPKEDT